MQVPDQTPASSPCKVTCRQERAAPTEPHVLQEHPELQWAPRSHLPTPSCLSGASSLLDASLPPTGPSSSSPALRAPLLPDPAHLPCIQAPRLQPHPPATLAPPALLPWTTAPSPECSGVLSAPKVGHVQGPAAGERRSRTEELIFLEEAPLPVASGRPGRAFSSVGKEMPGWRLFSLSQNNAVCIAAERIYMSSPTDRPHSARGSHAPRPSGGSKPTDKRDPPWTQAPRAPPCPPPGAPGPSPGLRPSWALGECAQPAGAMRAQRPRSERRACGRVGPGPLVLSCSLWLQGWRRLATATVLAIPDPVSNFSFELSLLVFNCLKRQNITDLGSIPSHSSPSYPRENHSGLR